MPSSHLQHGAIPRACERAQGQRCGSIYFDRPSECAHRAVPFVSTPPCGFVTVVVTLLLSPTLLVFTLYIHTCSHSLRAPVSPHASARPKLSPLETLSSNAVPSGFENRVFFNTKRTARLLRLLLLLVCVEGTHSQTTHTVTVAHETGAPSSHAATDTHIHTKTHNTTRRITPTPCVPVPSQLSPQYLDRQYPKRKSQTAWPCLRRPLFLLSRRRQRTPPMAADASRAH